MGLTSHRAERGLDPEYRTFEYMGRSIVCQRHLKVGASDDEQTLRIHFERDEATGKIVIGHVGKHLKSYSVDG